MHYTYTMYTTNADDADVVGDNRVLRCPIDRVGATGRGRPTGGWTLVFGAGVAA